MNTSAIKVEPLATEVAFGEDSFCIILADGREITVPIEWFPRLRDATEDQRSNWRLIGGGIGIHWPAIDEDVSVESVLALE